MSYMGINDYSNILKNYTTSVVPTSVMASRPVSEVEEPKTIVREENLSEALKASERIKIKNIDIEDVSLTFNASDDFGYIGKDADIKNLDVVKAISDMQKDGILKQYQYFVNSSGVSY